MKTLKINYKNIKIWEWIALQPLKLLQINNDMTRIVIQHTCLSLNATGKLNSISQTKKNTLI